MSRLKCIMDFVFFHINSQYGVNVENFLTDIVFKEISFAKENLIDFPTENGYCFGFNKGSVECLHRIIKF